uniref:Uncharacterized protein n=1 Tax=Romanomermis culicivorax TaxID=13658 RepID=A0A915L9I5_ROMCU
MSDIFKWMFIVSLFHIIVTPSKLNQKIFVDVDTIDFLDPQKHGFLVILNEYFVKNFLHESQFPTLFVTWVHLYNSKQKHSSHNNQHRWTRILYPEVIQERKVVKLENLKEKSWYIICIEFENMNRDNETTGLTCRISRTLDKFGTKTETTINRWSIDFLNHDFVNFSVEYQWPLFPMKNTFYLTAGGVEAKTFLIESQNREKFRLRSKFEYLESNTDYGKICVLQEPTIDVFSMLGRTVKTNLHICHESEKVRTKSAPKRMGDGKFFESDKDSTDDRKEYRMSKMRSYQKDDSQAFKRYFSERKSQKNKFERRCMDEKVESQSAEPAFVDVTANSFDVHFARMFQHLAPDVHDR